METLIELLQAEFKAALSLKHHKRLNPSLPKRLKVIAGMRQTGKTKYLHQLATNLPLERLLYLDFEDHRLFPFTHSMRQLIDTWFALSDEKSETRYLFLDGVDRCEVWPLVLRKLLDTKNVEIYATGSSAKMLETEMAQPLKERASYIEMWPYSYAEYSSAHPATGSKKNHFIQYLLQGAIPHPQRTLEKVIFRDMVERHQIGNVTLLKTYLHYLFESVTHPFSINKFYCDIKSQGIKVAKDTLHLYLDYLEEAFLLFAVPIYPESQNKTTPRKIYLGDTGLAAATNSKRPQLSTLFENLVYLDLRRQQKKVCYFPTKKGDVFVTEDLQGKKEIVQADWNNDGGKALTLAQNELGFPALHLDYLAYQSTSSNLRSAPNE